MSSRRWWRLLAALSSTALVGALMLAAAGPLDAGGSSTKTYTLGVSVGQNGTNSFSATFTNTTTNASINSVTLDQPAGFQFYSITSTSCTTIVSESVGLSNNCSVSLGTDPASSLPAIVVTNLNPLNYKETVTISWTFSSVPSSPTCNTSWYSNAWTGSNLSGTLFVPAPPATSGVAVTLSSGASTSVSSSTVSSVTIKNNDTKSASFSVVCGTNNRVSVLKSGTVNLTVDILWNAEPAQYPMPPTQVDTPSTSQVPTHAIEWCSTDSSGTLSEPSSTWQGAPTNSKEVACLISEQSQVKVSNTVQVHDVVLLNGDPSVFR